MSITARASPAPQVGAIAVMGRHGGGHVGVVSGIDANGNPIIVSGNHNHTVAESVYPRALPPSAGQLSRNYPRSENLLRRWRGGIFSCKVRSRALL